MKKFILSLVLVLTCIFVFAQEAAPVIDPVFWDQIWNWITQYISAQNLTIAITVAWVLDYVVTYINWIPANSTLELIFVWAKKLIHFLAGKKKV
jgi:hypothetical protein